MDNGWNEWGKYVLEALKENKQEHKDMCNDVKEILKELEALKVKASVWGGMSGILAAGTILLISYLRGLNGA